METTFEQMNQMIESNINTIVGDSRLYRLFYNINNTNDFSFLGNFDYKNENILQEKIQQFDFVPDKILSYVLKTFSGELACLKSLTARFDISSSLEYNAIKFYDDDIEQKTDYYPSTITNSFALQQLRSIYPGFKLYVPIENKYGLFVNVALHELKLLGFDVDFLIKRVKLDENIIAAILQPDKHAMVNDILGENISPSLRILLNNNMDVVSFLKDVRGVDISIAPTFYKKDCDNKIYKKFIANLQYLKEIIKEQESSQPKNINFVIPSNLCELQFINLASNLPSCYGYNIFYQSGTIYLTKPEITPVEKPSDFCDKLKFLVSMMNENLTFDELVNIVKISSFRVENTGNDNMKLFDYTDVWYLYYHMITSNHVFCAFVCALILKYRFNADGIEIKCINLWPFIKSFISANAGAVKLSCCGVLHFGSLLINPFIEDVDINMDLQNLDQAVRHICVPITTQKSFFDLVNRTMVPKITATKYIKYIFRNNLSFFFMIFQLAKYELQPHERMFVEKFIRLFHSDQANLKVNPPSEFNQNVVDALFLNKILPIFTPPLLTAEMAENYICPS